MSENNTHFVESKKIALTEVYTNEFGMLRFKTSDESKAIAMYAEEISTDRAKFDFNAVKKLPGFRTKQTEDYSRCLKPLPQPKPESSSTES